MSVIGSMGVSKEVRAELSVAFDGTRPGDEVGSFIGTRCPALFLRIPSNSAEFRRFRPNFVNFHRVSSNSVLSFVALFFAANACVRYKIRLRETRRRPRWPTLDRQVPLVEAHRADQYQRGRGRPHCNRDNEFMILSV